jgi:hypothetical protein
VKRDIGKLAREQFAQLAPEAQFLCRTQVTWLRPILRDSTDFHAFMSGTMMSFYDMMKDESKNREAIAMAALVYTLAIEEEFGPKVEPASDAS